MGSVNTEPNEPSTGPHVSFEIRGDQRSPRLKSMILPGPEDQYEWVLVIDRAGDLLQVMPEYTADRLAAKVGAKACLIFAGEVEVW